MNQQEVDRRLENYFFVNVNMAEESAVISLFGVTFNWENKIFTIKDGENTLTLPAIPGKDSYYDYIANLCQSLYKETKDSGVQRDFNAFVHFYPTMKNFMNVNFKYAVP